MKPCRSWGVLAVSFVVVAGIVPAAAQGLRPELQATFERGVGALKAGRLDAAEAAFRAVLDGGGAPAYVHNNLGIVYEQRGEHEKAVAQFREAIRKDPAYAAPRILLGARLLAQGRVEEARVQLRRAVKIAPREKLARLELARACQRAADWAEAVEQYRQLRQIEPDNLEHAYGLGTSFLRLAQQSLTRLQEVAPGSARVQQALGHSFRVQGEPDRALEAFARAAEADPALPEIHLVMAQVHMEQKRWADARREAEAELAIVPESAGAKALLAHLARLEAARP
jgi:tetratricopeptide (TPR) repeat protein